MTGWFNWIRLRILAADSAWYKFRVNRELKRRAKKARDVDYSSVWFICLALGIASCAHRAYIRDMSTMRDECNERINRSPSSQADAIAAECEERMRDR